MTRKPSMESPRKNSQPPRRDLDEELERMGAVCRHTLPKTVKR